MIDGHAPSSAGDGAARLNQRGTRPALRAPHLLAFLLVATGVLLCGLSLVKTPANAFWDARIYGHALGRWVQGFDPYVLPGPYVQGQTFLFVGPPVFLETMGLFRHVFPGSFGLTLYIALAVLSCLGIPALLARYYLRSPWFPSSLALAIFAASFGTWALLTGNITDILYAAALAAGIPGLRQNQWWPFLGVVALAGLVKPPFLALLLLPLLVGQAQWLATAASVLACVAGYALQWRLAPRLFREFQENVRLQVVVHRDAGFGLYLHLLRPGKPPLMHGLSPSVLDTLLVMPVLLLLLWLRWRRPVVLSSPFWLPCILVFALVCNPRLQTYDVDVAMVPAVYILVQFFRTMSGQLLRFFGAGAVVLAWAACTPARREIATLLTLLAAIALALFRLLRPSATVERVAARQDA